MDDEQQTRERIEPEEWYVFGESEKQFEKGLAYLDSLSGLTKGADIRVLKDDKEKKVRGYSLNGGYVVQLMFEEGEAKVRYRRGLDFEMEQEVFSSIILTKFLGARALVA